MDYLTFFEWIENLFNGMSEAGTWIITPINFGSFSIAPIYLISVGGLITFIAVAVIKWIIS